VQVDLVLEGIKANRVVTGLLLLAQSLGSSLGGGEAATLSAGEVGAEIQGSTETTLLLDLLDVGTENLVVNSVDLSNGLTDSVDLSNLVGSATSDLGDAELGKLSLKGVQLLDQLGLGLLTECLQLQRSGYCIHIIPHSSHIMLTAIKSQTGTRQASVY
jgi:hypothetical protein